MEILIFIIYQVIRGCVPRQITAGYRLFPSEWDKSHAEILLPPDAGQSRHTYLLALKKKIAEDTARLNHIISRLKRTGVIIPQNTW